MYKKEEQVLDDFIKNNAPYYFERKYNNDIYNPAAKAREKKLVNYSQDDFDDFRAEREKVFKKHKNEYDEKYKNIENEIKSSMDKLDSGLDELKTQRQTLYKEREQLVSKLNNIKYQHKSMEDGLKKLRDKGILK
ncbi:hypothetical protein [Klebsiella oxytoca]|uniref:hypothetical protein n=1 Tax=Klebsiella oxytoca TaxID=571 RepID=UPI0039C9316A